MSITMAFALTFCFGFGYYVGRWSMIPAFRRLLAESDQLRSEQATFHADLRRRFEDKERE